MGCSTGPQSHLEQLRKEIVELSQLVITANICDHQQQEAYSNVMKQIEVKCSLIKKQLSIINKEIVDKEDIQAFADLNTNYQNQIASVNRKLQGYYYYLLIIDIDMITVNPALESAFLI